MDTHTKAVPLLNQVALLLDVSSTELVSMLTQEFKTICADPIEAPRYPSTQEAFLDFALNKISALNPASLATLKKIIHRDEVRKFYFFPNELEAINRILEVIEKSDRSDLFLDRLELFTLPPLLLKIRTLRYLDISNNYLKDLSLLVDIPDLEVIVADHNQVSDLSCLIGAPRLEGLGLGYNNIRETLEVLQTIPTLQGVDLSHNKINDTQVKMILEIPSIKKVNLTGNPVNAPVDILNDIEKLRAHFKIVFLKDMIDEALKIPEQQQAASQEASIPPSNTTPDEPVYISSAIRDIRLRGNPDKVLLDIEKLAPIFYDLISNSDRNGEHFFGLFGRWGRGKTFFWKYLLEHNLNREKYIPIEFHAWKYQDTPGVWAYLYNTLNDAYMGEKPKWYQLAKLLKYFWKLVRLNDLRGKLLNVAAILLGIGAAIIGYFYNEQVRGDDAVSQVLRIGIPASVISLVVYMAKTFKTDARKIISSITSNINFNSQLGFQHEIQQELKHLVRAWIPEKDKFKKRIFLFIDDIDRCSEDKIIQIVDYIRVLLHCETIQDRITVLAAIDERILLHAIQVKYKQFIENKDNDATYKELCREYMDKLFLAGLKLGPLTEFEKRQIVEGFTDVDTSNSVVWPDYSKNGIDSEKVAEVINQTNEKDMPAAANEETGHEIDHGTGKGAPKKVVIPEPEQTVETSTSSYNTAIPVTPSPIASTARKEFPYEKWEQEFIKDILARNTESTPRSIRVYTYRYLLGKQLVEKALQQGKASWKQWYNTKEAKQCFAIKLLHYGFKSDTDHLMADYKNFIVSYHESNTVKESIYGYEIALNQELGSIMFQVLTMIIAY